MNKFLLICLLVAFQLPAIAQQPTIINDPKAKLRTITGSFSKIAVSSGIELYLTQGDETALAISVSDEQYEKSVKAEVKNGVLQIGFDNHGANGTRDKNRKIKAYLSCKTLEGISGSSGAYIRVQDEFNIAEISLDISSGARLAGRFQTKTLNANVSSGGNIEISGVAVNSILQASSGAVLKAYKLTTKHCNAKASSGATINIAVEKELIASASTGGVVFYKGYADLIKKHVGSGGSVKHTS